MFYGSRRHLKSFSGNFLMLMFLLGCLLTNLVKSLVFSATIFELITAKHCPSFLGIPMTRNHLVDFCHRSDRMPSCYPGSELGCLSHLEYSDSECRVASASRKLQVYTWFNGENIQWHSFSNARVCSNSEDLQ